MTSPKLEKWNPIETAPEDEVVLLATTGDWVDTAILHIDEEAGERHWFWFPATPIHENHAPLAWMPLPAPPQGDK